MSIYKELARIQKELKAPKNQYNSFGSYHYRSCEDILEAVKSVTDCAVIIKDSIEIVADRIYVKSTASLVDSEGNIVETCAFAREPLDKKGMDEAQITGATSSYARKYALNALFSIDDTKDADASNDHADDQKPEDVEKEWYNDFDIHKDSMIKKISAGTKANEIISSLRQQYKVSKAVAESINSLEKT